MVNIDERYDFICIHSLLARFWWGAKAEERKLHWHSWQSLCLPKSMGGLGFRDLHCFNQALLAKQAWRLCQGEFSLLHSLLKARYYKNSECLDARRGYNPSFTWRSIWGSKSLLLEGLKWCVGDGMSIRVWESAWLLGEGNHLVPTMKPDSDPELRVSDLIDFQGGGWNVSLVKNVFVEEEWGSILNIPLSRFWPRDSLFWWPGRDGMFTVRSCYWLARLGHLRTWALQFGARETELWRDVWRVEGPPKLNHFIWRACKGSLAVAERLASRHVAVSSQCPVCGCAEESIIHALFECTHAQQLWSASEWGSLLIDAPSTSFADRFAWFKSRGDGEEVRRFYALAWAAWFCRNKCVYEHENPDAVRMGCSFVKLVSDYKEYADKVFNPPSVSSPMVSSWSPPMEGWVKLNFDAHISVAGEVGLGVVCRNHHGQIIALGVRRGVAEWEATLAEAMGARYTMELAARLGYVRVSLEGDSLLVVNAVKDRRVGATPIFRIFSDITFLAGSLESFSISHVRRAGNAVAHLLARWVCPAGDEIVWLDSFPPSITTLGAIDSI